MRSGISRRSFLALAGSGAALGALARLPRAALASVPAAAAPFFSADESDVLLHVVERMVDTGLPDAPRVRDTAAIATIDRLCAGLDPALTQPIPILMRAVDWGPYVFDWRWARFRELDDAGKDASLAGWMTSSLALRRLAFAALKNLAMLGWYSQDASWKAIAYQGPLIARRGTVS
jgi:hypothetical protein